MLKIITYFIPILFIILFTPFAQAEGTTSTNINIIPLNSSDVPNIIKERHERFGALCIAEIKEEDKLLYRHSGESRNLNKNNK